MKQSDINIHRNTPVAPQQLLINGQWRGGRGEKITTISPIDGQPVTTLAGATADDVNEAVIAARASFESGVWSRSAPAFRKQVLHKLADLITENALEIAVLGVRDNGTEIRMALQGEPGSSAATFRYYAEALDKVYGEVAPTNPNSFGMILREPSGVVGAIIPWNFPMMICAWKIAAALAVGNSIVLKPSEVASLTLLKIGELAQQAGLPDGVLNIVTGRGSVVGSAMSEHKDIDVIGFTGSGATGAKLMHASANSNMKQIFLELGGKSPNVIFSDTKNLQEAAQVSAAGIFRNSGEVCIAASRLLVERSILKEFTEMMVENANNYRVGDPLDLSNDIGAVTNHTQLVNDLDFVARAVKEEAKLLAGGKQLHQETGGYYMQPTILGEVSPDMDIFQNEVFGPVLTITAFDTEAEALYLANATKFGLSSGVWTTDLSRAHRMIRGLHSGVVHVNTYGGADVTVPLGGVKQSGHGSDKSLHGMYKYTNLKTAWINI